MGWLSVGRWGWLWLSVAAVGPQGVRHHASAVLVFRIKFILFVLSLFLLSRNCVILLGRGLACNSAEHGIESSASVVAVDARARPKVSRIRYGDELDKSVLWGFCERARRLCGGGIAVFEIVVGNSACVERWVLGDLSSTQCFGVGWRGRGMDSVQGGF